MYLSLWIVLGLIWAGFEILKSVAHEAETPRNYVSYCEDEPKDLSNANYWYTE